MAPVSSRAFFMTNVVANRVLIPVLKSRAGRRLGRQLAVVEYQGRHSGQPHRLVTQYVTDGHTVRVAVGNAERKTWWRNFQAAHPVRLRLAGTDHDATAHVVREGDQVYVVAELTRRTAPGNAPASSSAHADST